MILQYHSINRGKQMSDISKQDMINIYAIFIPSCIRYIRSNNFHQNLSIKWYTLRRKCAHLSCRNVSGRAKKSVMKLTTRNMKILSIFTAKTMCRKFLAAINLFQKKICLLCMKLFTVFRTMERVRNRICYKKYRIFL